MDERTAYITHNEPWPHSDNTEGTSSDHMQLLLEPLKAFYYLFHMQWCSARHVNKL